MTSKSQSAGKIRASIPSLITLTGMSFGFFSILLTGMRHFELALWLIVYAVLTDKLDGFAARRLNVVSEIGMQLDSLSDLITFGVAPAVAVMGLAVLKWHVQIMSPLGVFFTAASLTFLWASATRLAKFNVITHDDHEHFVGVSTTHSAAIVATMALTAIKYGWGHWFLGLLPAVYFALAALMLSHVLIPKLGKGKSSLFRGAQVIVVPFVFVVGLLQVFPEFLFSLAVIYFVVGVIETFSSRKDAN